jgi:hypothetical protein
MLYHFYGKHFYFIKECSDLDHVKLTIERCKRTYKTQEYYNINRRINKVVDNLGIVIYSGQDK